MAHLPALVVGMGRKLQAASSKQQATLDNGYGIV